MKRRSVVDIVEITYAKHKRDLDPDLLKLAWAYKVAWEAEVRGLLQSGPLLIAFLRSRINRRHSELLAARWYEAN